MKVTFDASVTEIRKLHGSLGYEYEIRFKPPGAHLGEVAIRLPLVNPKTVELGQQVEVTIDTEPVEKVMPDTTDTLLETIDRMHQREDMAQLGGVDDYFVPKEMFRGAKK